MKVVMICMLIFKMASIIFQYIKPKLSLSDNSKPKAHCIITVLIVFLKKTEMICFNFLP